MEEGEDDWLFIINVSLVRKYKFLKVFLFEYEKLSIIKYLIPVGNFENQYVVEMFKIILTMTKN